MFKVDCAKCKKELFEPGALIFSPPEEKWDDFNRITVEKFHLCIECFKVITDIIEGYKEAR